MHGHMDVKNYETSYNIYTLNYWNAIKNIKILINPIKIHSWWLFM
jgi:hypothetical protein